MLKIRSQGKASLYSVISIAVVIILGVISWKSLEIARNMYTKKFKTDQKFTIERKKIFNQKQKNSSVLDKINQKLVVSQYKAQLKYNLKTTISLMEQYSKAQEIYFKKHGHYADGAASLIIEEPKGQIRRIDPDLSVIAISCSKKQPYCGYLYRAETIQDNSGQNQRFFLFAIPVKNELSGPNILYIDNQGIVKYDGPKGDPTKSF